jgi:hypothetical protein
MFRVMYITEVCDFGRQQSREPEGLPSEQVVVVGGRQAAIRQSAARHRVAYNNSRRHRVLKVLLLFCALQLVGCAREQQPSPEIVAEINTLQQQTVALSSSLLSPARISKHKMSVQADWQVKDLSTTKEYFDWVKQQLGADFRVVSQTESALIMQKTLPGDLYTLELRSNPPGSNIDVHFLAMPD